MATPDLLASNFYAETATPLLKERRMTARAIFRSMIALGETSADFLACTAGLFAAHLFCASFGLGAAAGHSGWQVSAMCAAFGFVVIFLLWQDGTYRSSGGLLQIRETERAIRVPAQALFLLLIISCLLGLAFTWPEFLVAIALVPILLIVEKRFFFAATGRMLRAVRSTQRVAILGGGDTGRSVVSYLLHSPRLGLQPVAVIDDSSGPGSGCMPEMGYRGRRSIPVHSGPVTAAFLKSLQCDLLLIATRNASPEKLAVASNAAHHIGLDVALLRGASASEQLWTESIDVDGVLFTALRVRPASLLYALSKRITDVIVSSVLLVVLAPLMMLIAILIRLDSPGPALFVQERVGRNGERFNMYKFRSMLANAPRYSLSPASSNDPRITRIGRLLRRMSLDELPQLINVFLGTMSLVGPRPEMPFIVDGYDARQRLRLRVSPGITGLWQLSADRAFPIHQNIQYDFYYIRNRSFCMDVAILLHTLVFALSGGI